MTRNMAIKWLKWIQNMFSQDSEQYKALDFAIDSLEVDEAYQLEYERVQQAKDVKLHITNIEKHSSDFSDMEDCVKRSDVVKILTDIDEAVYMGEGYEYDRWRDRLDELPSVYQTGE